MISQDCLTTKCLQLIISSLHGVQFNDETPLSFHGLVQRQTAPDNFCRVPKPSDIFLCIFGNIRCLHMNRNHRHDLPQAEILFQQN